MARTAITRTTIPHTIVRNAAVTEADADDSNGNKFDNTEGKALLMVRNITGGSATITIASVADPNTGRTADISQSVAGGETRVFGPFEPSLYNQSDNTINVNSTVGTGVKVSVLLPA